MKSPITIANETRSALDELPFEVSRTVVADFLSSLNATQLQDIYSLAAKITRFPAPANMVFPNPAA